MATRSLGSFSYSLRPRVTLYFKGALFSIQRCINQFFMKIKKIRKKYFFLLYVSFSSFYYTRHYRHALRARYIVSFNYT